MGSVTQTDNAAAPRPSRRRSNAIQIRNFPTSATKEEIEALLSPFGALQRCDIDTESIEPVISATFELPEQATQALEQLNNSDFQGSALKVDYVGGRSPRTERHRNGGTHANGHAAPGYPLRILVPSDFVGAIIGKKGQTIRDITAKHKARVDVHGKENAGLVEKVIAIHGQPENCTKTCLEILQVMEQEAQRTGKGEIILKIVTEDRYCGRIIGKEGKVIKQIREETDTKITVSNFQETPSIFPDRVIAVRGTPEHMSAAEAIISSKLRECYERDQKNLGAAGMMMPMVAGMGQLSLGAGGMYGGAAGAAGGLRRQFNAAGGPAPFLGAAQQPITPMSTVDTCQISVPNSAVGALIGSGGSNIKLMIRESGAFVTIEPKKDSEDSSPAAERTVTVRGSPEAIWRASFLVFDKLKQEGFAGTDDVRLRTSIRVPKSVVGRVIGKGGQNVRDIQRMTGALIKLPESQTAQVEEVTVEIFGNFMATQNAQGRVRALVMQSTAHAANGNGPRGPRGPRGPHSNGHNNSSNTHQDQAAPIMVGGDM